MGKILYLVGTRMITFTEFIKLNIHLTIKNWKFKNFVYNF